MRYVAVNRCDSKHGMRYVAVKHCDSKHGIRYVVVKHRDSKHAYGLMAAVNYIDRLCFSRLLCMVRLAQGNSVC
jgi:type IV secretory pathway VirD2 relaxase